MKPLKERFKGKINIQEDCWIWNGTINNDGYGVIVVKEKRLRAHRVSYEAFIAPIPKNLWVLHTCHKTLCVNPKHLYIGTPTDNNRDTVKAGHNKNKQKTHCKNGHEFKGINLIISNIGKRVCRTCKNIYQSKRNKERRG